MLTRILLFKNRRAEESGDAGDDTEGNDGDAQGNDVDDQDNEGPENDEGENDVRDKPGNSRREAGRGSLSSSNRNEVQSKGEKSQVQLSENSLSVWKS